VRELNVGWDKYLDDNPYLGLFERAVHRVLEDWMEAIEDGTATQRLPRPNYTRPDGKPLWTEAQLEELVGEAIDDYVDRQRDWMRRNRNIATDSDPGYRRLDGPQRLALAQDLLEVCVQFEQSTGTPPPPPVADPPVVDPATDESLYYSYMG
jgi:hypothetical protein